MRTYTITTLQAPDCGPNTHTQQYTNITPAKHNATPLARICHSHTINSNTLAALHTRTVTPYTHTIKCTTSCHRQLLHHPHNTTTDHKGVALTSDDKKTTFATHTHTHIPTHVNHRENQTHSEFYTVQLHMRIRHATNQHI